MQEIRRYTIGKKRMTSEKAGKVCRIRIRRLDGERQGNVWGRLFLDVRLTKGSICAVYGMASDRDGLTEEEEGRRWQKEFHLGNNCRHILLDSLRGRYLWLSMELLYAGEEQIREMYVESPGRVFLEKFPEAYREGGDFLCRYLAVFSSLYSDLDRKITEAPELLKVSEAPEKLLDLYLEWMGMSTEDRYYPEEIKRKLLMQLYWLNRRKGTRQAFIRLTEIVLGEPAAVIEQEGRRILVLVRQKRIREQAELLLRLLQEFKPARSSVRLVFPGESAYLDDAAYLDMGSACYAWPDAVLDGEVLLDECVLRAGETGPDRSEPAERRGTDGIVYRNCGCQ